MWNVESLPAGTHHGPNSANRQRARRGTGSTERRDETCNGINTRRIVSNNYSTRLLLRQVKEGGVAIKEQWIADLGQLPSADGSSRMHVKRTTR